MIEFLSSKDGNLTAKFDGVYLHSAYSPRKEAENFYIKEKLERFSTFILIDPCLNYSGSLIKEKNPGVKVISIYTYKAFAQRDNSISDFLWCRKDGDSLKNFLYKAMQELDLEQFRLIEWPAAAKSLKAPLSGYKDTITQHIRELHGNITTSSGFGSRIVKNFIKNYLSADKVSVPRPTDSTFFIAGSGPGLANSIPFLKRNRQALFITALPSSINYLLSFGIKPDLIVSTDPGYYAGHHIRTLNNCLIASPLTANLLSSLNDNHLIPINQQSFIETSFRSNFGSFINIPSNGTVAGTAMFLAAMLTTGRIIVSGLDFSFIDILSHNRPHSFDRIIEQKSSRTSSLQSLYYDRNIAPSVKIESGPRRTTTALNVYRGWFERSSSIFSKRCFFMEHFEKPPGDFTNLSEAEAESMLSADAKLSFDILNFSAPEKRRLDIEEYLHIQDNSLSVLSNSLSEESIMDNKLISMLYSSIAGNIFLPDILEMKRISFNKNSKEVLNKAVSLIERTRSFLDYLGRYAG